MSHRGRIKRRGRRNCVLSVLVLLLLLWYVSTSVSRVTISSVTAFAAGACGATSGWVGWRTPKAHKRQTPIKQVRPGARLRPVLPASVADPQRADPLDRRHRRWPVVAGAAIAARQLAIGGRRDCVGQRTGQAEQGPVPAGGDVRDYALHDVLKRACSGGRRLSVLSVCPDALRCCQFRLVWEARRCSLWVEGRSRRRRKRPEQRGGAENPLSSSRR